MAPFTAAQCHRAAHSLHCEKVPRRSSSSASQRETQPLRFRAASALLAPRVTPAERTVRSGIRWMSMRTHSRLLASSRDSSWLPEWSEGKRRAEKSGHEGEDTEQDKVSSNSDGSSSSSSNGRGSLREYPLSSSDPSSISTSARFGNSPASRWIRPEGSGSRPSDSFSTDPEVQPPPLQEDEDEDSDDYDGAEGNSTVSAEGETAIAESPSVAVEGGPAAEPDEGPAEGLVSAEEALVDPETSALPAAATASAIAAATVGATAGAKVGLDTRQQPGSELARKPQSRWLQPSATPVGDPPSASSGPVSSPSLSSPVPSSTSVPPPDLPEGTSSQTWLLGPLLLAILGVAPPLLLDTTELIAKAPSFATRLLTLLGLDAIFNFAALVFLLLARDFMQRMFVGADARWVRRRAGRSYKAGGENHLDKGNEGSLNGDLGGDSLVGAHGLEQEHQRLRKKQSISDFLLQQLPPMAAAVCCALLLGRARSSALYWQALALVFVPHLLLSCMPSVIISLAGPGQPWVSAVLPVVYHGYKVVQLARAKEVVMALGAHPGFRRATEVLMVWSVFLACAHLLKAASRGNEAVY